MMPDLIFSRDAEHILGVGPRAARAWMHKIARAGVPLLRLGRRLAVRRADFERVLAAFEIPTAPRPRSLPRIDPEYLDLVKPRPRRGRNL